MGAARRLSAAGWRLAASCLLLAADWRLPTADCFFGWAQTIAELPTRQAITALRVARDMLLEMRLERARIVALEARLN